MLSNDNCIQTNKLIFYKTINSIFYTFALGLPPLSNLCKQIIHSTGHLIFLCNSATVLVTSHCQVCRSVNATCKVFSVTKLLSFLHYCTLHLKQNILILCDMPNSLYTNSFPLQLCRSKIH